MTDERCKPLSVRDRLVVTLILATVAGLTLADVLGDWTSGGYLTDALPESIWEPDKQLARSSHNREFRYVGQSHGPGAMAIWHLWIAA